MSIIYQCLIVLLSPLLSALICGFLGKKIGRTLTHWIACICVAVSFFASLILAKQMFWDGTLVTQNINLYEWSGIDALKFNVGLLIDSLSLTMMMVVSFISWMVHIYTIGYMNDDAGYQRFFSYIALFTFAMLSLVMSNNCLQLFFGWEGVGLVSYLLIGFWYQKPTAIFANFKAFLVNRVGDLGFLLGIGAILWAFGSLDYATIFSRIDNPAAATISLFQGYDWSIYTVTAILLFIGAMGKSAQIPLHVWLPDSMEGPTPISALIHAATMVTAGVFMVARFSPIFELSDVALNFVLIIGATTCLFTGLLGIIQNDIKRIIAYSTLSQLGYMVAALGASAYSIGLFHLVTHAFFKALLFLGAGSVIVAMHHEQDIRKMGGLCKYLPITYITMLLGSLALAGFPFFSGFYSKDLIIEAVQLSHLPAAKWAYFAVLSSVFVTAFYSFRLLFVVFHTKPRMDSHTQSHLHEPQAVIWLPLVILAIPSVILGYFLVTPILQNFLNIYVDDVNHQALKTLSTHFHNPIEMGLHGLSALPFWFALGGIIMAWLMYIQFPHLPSRIKQLSGPLYNILKHKYGFDAFNRFVIAAGTRGVGWLCWKVGDQFLIDGMLVNGSAKVTKWSARILQPVQSGYLYHYAFAMIAGLMGLLLWLTWRGFW